MSSTQPSWLKPEITAGNVIQIATIVVAIAAAWSNLAARTSINEMQIAANREAIQQINDKLATRVAAVEKASVENGVHLEAILEILQSERSGGR